MLKYLRNSLPGLITGLALIAIPIFAPAMVSADSTTGAGGANIQGNLSCGVSLQASTGDCSGSTTTGAGKVQGIVTDMINIFSLVVGIISVIMIVYGGFKYITSGGDSGNVTGARNTITYAVIGLVIVALAQFIVQFVLNKVTSAGQGS